MIAPMKKFWLVLLEKDVDKAPLYLRKLGIAHVENFESSGEACEELERKLKNAKTAASILSAYSGRGKKDRPRQENLVDEVVDKVLEIDTGIVAERDKIGALNHEIDRTRDWGNFDPRLMAGIGSGGIAVRLYECSPRQLKEMPSDIDFIRLTSSGGKVRLAVLGEVPLPQDFLQFKASAESLEANKRALQESERRVADMYEELRSLVPNLRAIEKAVTHLESDLKVERLRSGMPAEENLFYLSGYVPAKVAGTLKTEASGRGWALALDDPSDSDMPPTKVENPPAVRIIQPIFDFLGTVPNYREYDISLWFLIFFTIFFAMIFGDGGYGLIMLAAAGIMSRKSRKKKIPVSEFTKLLFVLGGATTLWGMISSTWFAIPFESLPPILQKLSVPALNAANPDSGTNIKILCFILGAVQLSIAHIKNIRRDFPNPKFLSQVGSLLLVIGMFNAVLNLVVDAKRFPIPNWALGFIGAGFLLVFVFGNWNGKLLASLMDSLKGIIPTFLGTVSVFADIISYIRLWAVGLAGLALSQTINGMALSMMGPSTGRIAAFLISGIFAVILLCVGHTLNFMMSILSVIVHGMRLNILEFSSHLGMEWSGYKYEPLSEVAEDIKG